jgi:exodeoxyribonuclease-5
MLNQSQKVAEQQIKQFLSTDHKFMALSAPAGYGKTYLIDSVIANTDLYNKRNQMLGKSLIQAHHVTATTNKAASVLQNGQTIQSLLGLALFTDYSTGKQTMKKTAKSTKIKNSLIFIDEASMASRDLKVYMDDLIDDSSKIILSGDDCQLAPVGEENSFAFNSGFPTATLDEPMRQDKDSDLFKLCQQLRETVKTGIWQPIYDGEGISRLTGTDVKKTLSEWFYNGMASDEAKIITYANDKAIKLNKFIRKGCGFSEGWQVGDIISSRNVCYDRSENYRTSIEEIVTITEIGSTVETHLGIRYVMCCFSNNYYFKVPLDPNEVKAAMAKFKSANSWRKFYEVKEHFLDIRSAYACTSHVSQGSTYDKVYVDLNDMARCWDAPTLARLLYVAVSRAKQEVVFNGKLPYKFQG